MRLRFTMFHVRPILLVAAMVAGGVLQHSAVRAQATDSTLVTKDCPWSAEGKIHEGDRNAHMLAPSGTAAPVANG